MNANKHRKIVSSVLAISFLLSLFLNFNVYAEAKQELIKTFDMSSYTEDGVQPTGWGHAQTTANWTMLISGPGEDGEGDHSIGFDTTAKDRWDMPLLPGAYTSGTYRLEFRFMKSDPTSIININVVSGNHNVRPGVTIPGGVTSNEWHTLDIILDVDSGSADSFIDDEKVNTFTGDWKGNGGFRYMYFSQWATGNTGYVYFDHVNVYSYYPEPEVSEISFVDLNNKTTVGTDSVIKASTKEMVVKFNTLVDSNNADFIEILDNNLEAPNYKLDFSGKNVIVSFPESLKPNRGYTLKVKQGFMSKGAKNELSKEEEYIFETDGGEVFGAVSPVIEKTSDKDTFYIYNNTFDVDGMALTDPTTTNGSINCPASFIGTGASVKPAYVKDGVLHFPAYQNVDLNLYFGKYLGQSDAGFEISFDVLLGTGNNLYMRFGSNTADYSKYNGSTDWAQLHDLAPGISAGTYNNAWHTFHIQVYPNSNISSQYIKMWVDNGSEKQTAYTMGSRAYVNKFILRSRATTDTEILIDNFVVKRNRVSYENQFTDSSSLTINGTKSTKDGPLSFISGAAIDDGTLHIPATNSGDKPFSFANVLCDNIITNKYKISFYLKTEEGSKLIFHPNQHATNEGSTTTPIYLTDASIGGDEPAYGEFQKYNFVIYPSANGLSKTYIWRGEESVIPTELDFISYTTPSGNEKLQWWSITSDGSPEFWVDDVKYEVYDSTYFYKKVDYTDIDYEIHNSTGKPQELWLIYSQYNEAGEMTGIKIKDVSIAADEYVMNIKFNIEKDFADAYSAKATLWTKDGAPVSDEITVEHHVE